MPFPAKPNKLRSEPKREKSTTTEPQEEFIEPKGRPSRAAKPSELRRAARKIRREREEQRQ